jgi:hypothetical protein
MTCPVNLSLRARVLALTLILAFRMNAQTSPAKPQLHILLASALCSKVQGVSVAINGRDDALPAIELSKCRWNLPEIESQNLEISYFSLRLDGIGRTPCRRATPGDGSNLQLVFTRRGLQPPHEIEILAGAPVDYARDLPASRDGDVQCWEKGTVPGKLSEVQFDVEHLRLRLFEKKPVACGVIIDEVASRGAAGKSVPVTVKDLAPLVVKQGLEGKNCYAPGLTPPEAIEPALRRQRLEIKVQ